MGRPLLTLTGLIFAAGVLFPGIPLGAQDIRPGHGQSPATPYACSGSPTPAANLAKIGGRVVVTGTCSFTGDLVLDGTGTTSITTNAATFNLAGNLVLSQS